MPEEIDPFELLNEEPESDIGTVLEDPYQVNFRSKEKHCVDVYPEALSFREAEVDLANNNVSIKTNLHQGDEKYTALLSTAQYTLVESLAKVEIQEKTSITAQYYVVTDDETILFDQNRGQWQTKYNPGVRKVAELTPQLYHEAQKIDEAQ